MGFYSFFLFFTFFFHIYPTMLQKDAAYSKKYKVVPGRVGRSVHFTGFSKASYRNHSFQCLSYEDV